MECAIGIAIGMANCLFQWKKSDYDVKLNRETSMIFISGIITIIIQKNTLCSNKVCVIYFWPNCVNFWLKKFIIYFLRGAMVPSAPPLCPQLVRLYGWEWFQFQVICKSNSIFWNRIPRVRACMITIRHIWNSFQWLFDGWYKRSGVVQLCWRCPFRMSGCMKVFKVMKLSN